MAEPILDGTTDAVAGGIRLVGNLRPWLTTMQRAWLAERIIHASEVVPHGLLTGANMAVRRSALDVLGGFDPALGPGGIGYGEESLLSLRLHDSGHRIMHRAGVDVEHHFDTSRLHRDYFTRLAAAMGRGTGYINYHYLQMRVTAPKLHALKHQVELTLTRLKHRAQPWQTEPQDWELQLIADVHTWEQYARERARPPRVASDIDSESPALRLGQNGTIRLARLPKTT